MKTIPMVKCARCKKELPIGLAHFLPEIKAYYRATSLALLHQTEMPPPPDDEAIVEQYGVSNSEDLFCEDCLKKIIANKRLVK